MNVKIEIPDLGVCASRAEIVDTSTDVITMQMTIHVDLYSGSGDRLKTILVDHQLAKFPIPSHEEQWQIVAPVLAEMQQANAA